MTIFEEKLFLLFYQTVLIFYLKINNPQYLFTKSFVWKIPAKWYLKVILAYKYWVKLNQLLEILIFWSITNFILSISIAGLQTAFFSEIKTVISITIIFYKSTYFSNHLLLFMKYCIVKSIKIFISDDLKVGYYICLLEINNSLH